MITKSHKGFPSRFHELHDECRFPSSFDNDIVDSELDFVPPSYFRWRFRRRSAGDDLDIEFGSGSLSPSQNVAMLLARAGRATGDYVKLLPSCHFCPMLAGDDTGIVWLYQFVEALDGLIDYDRIREELPLSYAQINGAFMFLRKVAQFNVKDIDIDKLEDEELETDNAFVAQLRQAISDQETTRVFTQDERDDR